MNKAVIFDLDGTLLDTLDDLTDSINFMLKEFGYRTLTRDEVRAIIGNGAKQMISDALPEKLAGAELKKRLDVYSKIYDASGSPKTKLFDGINEVVSELKNRGYKLAVLSNKPQHSTNKVAEKYLSGLGFDYIAGQSETIKCKPDPAGALYVLDKLGVKPENAYLVGDGETDVMAAINAGMNGIGALWGNRSISQLAAAGGTVFAETPKDLLKIIL